MVTALGTAGAALLLAMLALLFLPAEVKSEVPGTATTAATCSSIVDHAWHYDSYDDDYDLHEGGAELNATSACAARRSFYLAAEALLAVPASVCLSLSLFGAFSRDGG